MKQKRETVLGVVHEVHTPPPPGVMVRASLKATPLALKEALENQVQTMLRLGVIEESTIPWRNPPVSVPKPDGSVRFSIVFRKLNGVASFDAYPMPCWTSSGKPESCPQ